jgi:hypothetical protein
MLQCFIDNKLSNPWMTCCALKVIFDFSFTCHGCDFANDALRFECKPQALLDTVVFVHCSQEAIVTSWRAGFPVIILSMFAIWILKTWDLTKCSVASCEVEQCESCNMLMNPTRDDDHHFFTILSAGLKPPDASQSLLQSQPNLIPLIEWYTMCTVEVDLSMFIATSLAKLRWYDMFNGLCPILGIFYHFRVYSIYIIIYIYMYVWYMYYNDINVYLSRYYYYYYDVHRQMDRRMVWDSYQILPGYPFDDFPAIGLTSPVAQVPFTAWGIYLATATCGEAAASNLLFCFPA